MRKQWLKCLAIAVGMGVGPVVTAAGSGLESLNNADLKRIVKTELGAEQFDLASFELPRESGVGFFVAAEIDGAEYTLDLLPHSLRSGAFEVLVDDGTGELTSWDAPAPMTYRGSVVEIADSVVSASIVDGGLRGIIRFGDDQAYSITPLMEVVDGAPADAHLILEADDSLPLGFICGNDALNGFGDHPGDLHSHGQEGFVSDDPGVGIDDILLAEIAFDADVEFYNRNQQSVSGTIADIEAVMNDVDVIYQRDVEVAYLITTIIVRTGEPDPYSSTNAGTLLDQFQSEWNRNQGGVQRDVAHLMTGKNLQGGTIGVAYLGVICARSVAYGLSESRFTSRWDWRVGLTAHELGHNWNAGHCRSSCSGGTDCRIMCPCIGGCSGDMTRFGQASINAITNFRNSRNCLDPYFELLLEVGDLNSGQNANFSVSDGTPNEVVRVYYSLRGEGDCFIPEFGVSLNLDRCVLGLSGVTDGSGSESWVSRMPSVNRAVVLWIQAAQPDVISNLVLTQLNP
ncbi:MAG: M12 family metallo-peptidase [Phycisphaerales bacterium]